MAKVADTYVHPDSLVDTDWVADNLDNPQVRIIESNEDPLLYPSGHIPGALEVDWIRDLNHPLVRDYVSDERFSQLMSELGVTPDTHIVFYGDKGNWWACYSLWVFQLFGHKNCSIMNGGRLKWEKEGRPLTREVVKPAASDYPLVHRNDKKERAFREEVLEHVRHQGRLIDVRSPQEFTGERLHMQDYPNEGALRGGHIPGANSVPWSTATNPEDGTFKDRESLEAIYQKGLGLTPKDDVIVYCRIGERSSHTWFVLKYLLGFDQVRNYDGSWTEWGNSVGVPIEKP